MWISNHFSDVDLGVEAVAHLSQHPNIVGMKESGDSVSIFKTKLVKYFLSKVVFSS